MEPDIAPTRLGRYVETAVSGEIVRAFVPPPLPPQPPIRLDQLISRLSAADRAIGRLDGITAVVPNPTLFLYMYVRKEAVLSSQIEGTQSSLSDLLRFETDAVAGKPVNDVREVSNYVTAMTFGLERMKELPLSKRLMREMHDLLLREGRGESKNPGEFRTSQNWIGGSRPGNAVYVPPPALALMDCLGALETFMHSENSGLPPLIKAGLIHVQFETIHPFLDGNGRLGRLLITLYLRSEKVLQQPLLYLSLYFKTRRSDYYRLLQEVRERGDWEAWLEFFLEGVTETANQAFDCATRIVALYQRDRANIADDAERVRSASRIHELMQTVPYLTAATAAQRTGLSIPTVNAALESLTRLGIIKEITGKIRRRVYAYIEYLAILNDVALEPSM